MKDAGVITGDERDAMHAVIPDQRLDDAVFYADVGESLIHGHPKDWSDNPNDIHYYHCPETEHTQSFNHPVARAGQAHIMVPGPDAQTLAASRLLHALAPLESEEPGRVTEDLLASATRSLDAGDTLVAAGETLNAFTVILAGAMEEGSRARTLRSGDGIGLFYGVDDSGRASHDVVALSPTVVLEVTLEVLEDHLRAAGLSNLPGLIRRQLPFVERVEAFRSLSVSDRCRLARQLHLEPHAAGSSIPSSEDDSDVVLLLEGELRRSGLDIDAANGCKVLSPSDTRSQAVTEVVLGKLPRWLVDELRQHRMAVRIGLESLTR
ncbi:MAG: cyclic nucleotide-binding domain-containing protein [Myxococcota bacterium]